MQDIPPKVHSEITYHLDMDGVLTDFDEGLRRLGIDPKDVPNRPNSLLSPAELRRKEAVYARLAETDFFLTLPRMPDAVRLWTFMAPRDPVVLTAAPSFEAGREGTPVFLKFAGQKRLWIEWTLGPVARNRFICTTSEKKTLFLGHRPARLQVLVDDRASNLEKWEAAGGIGIRHLDAERTIAAALELERAVLAGQR